MQNEDFVPYERIKTWHYVPFKWVDYPHYDHMNRWLESAPGGAYWLGGYSVFFEQAEDAFQFALMWS